MSPKRKDIPNGMPDFKRLINPTLEALQSLGGSATVNEIHSEVIKNMQLSEKIIDFLHSDHTSQTEIQYRLGWARTYLKNYGIIEKTQRGIWTILPTHKDIKSVNVDECVNTVRNLSSNKKNNHTNPEANHNFEDASMELPAENKPWRKKLYHILINMNPYAFERLTQLLLRECGFDDVHVTKKSGDGGIDGTGKLKIGILSFQVAFQCKRYRGVVGSPEIRDFRGSLTTNIEKGIFITTGSFSKQAVEEASTPGKQRIELIDGENFISKLAEFGIGLKERKDYEIDENFFNTI